MADPRIFAPTLVFILWPLSLCTNPLHYALALVFIHCPISCLYANSKQVPRLLMEILFDPWTEARRLLSSQNQWMLYAEPLYRLREVGVVGVQVGVLDGMAEQALAPVTMHRWTQLTIAPPPPTPCLISNNTSIPCLINI